MVEENDINDIVGQKSYIEFCDIKKNKTLSCE